MTNSQQISRSRRCLVGFLLLITSVSGLSLSNCHARNNTTGLWRHAANPTSPGLMHHSATVYTDSQSHAWMLITGGFTKQKDEFHVWAMNLTHSELYNEEQWIRMNMTDAPLCMEIKSQSTQQDPTADLWSNATHCPPSPRGNHVTGIVNGYLYVFGGFHDSGTPWDFYSDPHVYRILVDEILAGQATPSSWEQIHPRVPLTQFDRGLTGGIWQQDPMRSPQMIVLVDSYILWSYDFTQDKWEVFAAIARAPIVEYSVAIIQDNMFLVDQFGYMIQVNLTNKYQEELRLVDFRCALGQPLVGYQDTVSNQTVLIMSYGDKQRFAINITHPSIERLALKDESTSFPYRPEQVHSAVLSNGRMYIFGGNSTMAVWSIDVGSKDCELGEPQGSEPQGKDKEYEENPYALIFSSLNLIRMCIEYGERRRRRRNYPPIELDQLPERILTEADTDTDLDCSICLEPFAVGNVVKDLPCNHYFHSGCVDSMNAWVQRHRTCPLCRRPVQAAVVNNIDNTEEIV